MNIMHKVFHVVKPFLPILIIVGVLQISGQLSNVVGYGQSALLKTGLFNPDDEPEPAEQFDYGFEAYTPDGKKLDTETLKNKVVFINLWATWCGPCRAEMPTIQSLYENNQDSSIVFVILSKDLDGNAESKVNNYIRKNKFTFPVYIEKETTRQLNVPSIPITFVISKKGKIVLTEIGMRDYSSERFRKFLDKLAAE